MPKIRFLETCVVDNNHKGTAKETRFEKGRVYDLNPASANHWLVRGKAEPAAGPDSVTVGPVKAEPAKPAITKATEGDKNEGPKAPPLDPASKPVVSMVQKPTDSKPGLAKNSRDGGR